MFVLSSSIRLGPREVKMLTLTWFDLFTGQQAAPPYDFGVSFARLRFPCQLGRTWTHSNASVSVHWPAYAFQYLPMFYMHAHAHMHSHTHTYTQHGSTRPGRVVEDPLHRLGCMAWNSAARQLFVGKSASQSSALP